MKCMRQDFSLANGYGINFINIHFDKQPQFNS